MKRMRVSADGTDMPGGANRQGTTFSEEQKLKAHQYCQSLYKFFVAISPESEHDVRFQILVSKWMYNAFTVARVASNDPNASRVEKFKSAVSSSAVFGAVTYTYDHAKALVAANKIDWKDQEMRGNVSTVMALWCIFGQRFDDCRIMPKEVVTGKSGETAKVLFLEDIGIPITARQHAVGINYPLSMQGSLAGSLGAMTVLYNLVKSESQHGRDYVKKWKNAAARVLSHIPDHANIITVLANNKVKDTRVLMAALSNLITLTCSRSQHRWAYPPIYLDRTDLKKVTFSSHESLHSYFMEAPTLKWPVQSQAMQSQLSFMAVTGTMFEDLGVLEFMTGVTEWYARDKYTEFFKGLAQVFGKNPASYSCTQIIPKYYSGAMGASPTQFFSPSSGPACGDVVFRGYRHRKITPALRALMDATSTSIMPTLTVNEAINHVSSLISKLKKTLDNKTSFDVGTTTWFSVDMDGMFVPTSEIAQEKGITYFHSTVQ